VDPLQIIVGSDIRHSMSAAFRKVKEAVRRGRWVLSGLGAVFLRTSLVFFRFRCSDFESQFDSFCVGAGDIETPAESLRQSTNDNEIDSASSLSEMVLIMSIKSQFAHRIN
jgi:hypothetical protein